MPRKARAAVGLSIAAELVRRGLARVTRENRFSAFGQRVGGAPPERSLNSLSDSHTNSRLGSSERQME